VKLLLIVFSYRLFKLLHSHLLIVPYIV
jgi:hypothetical protein